LCISYFLASIGVVSCRVVSHQPLLHTGLSLLGTAHTWSPTLHRRFV